MFLVNLLTSFGGRINRKSWWLGFAIILPAILGGMLLLNPEMFAQTETSPPLAPSLPYTIWALVWMIPSTAITVKRFNDRDWPNWLGYALGGLSAAYVAAEYFGYLIDPANFTPGEWSLFAIYMLFALFAFVDNGFLRGTPGPNEYGPDPRPAPLVA